MIKNIIFLFCILLTTSVFAKKIKFSVDMSNETVSPNGVHIMGDFQTVAGFSGGDFNSGTTTMVSSATWCAGSTRAWAAARCPTSTTLA